MSDIELIKAVLFDLDGVLIDSVSVWLSAFNDTLRKFGKESLDMDEFLNVYWGDELEVNLQKFGLGSDSVEYCKNKFVSQVDEIEVIFGAEEVIRSLDKQIALVTSTPRKLTIEILDHFEWKKYFDVIVDGDSVNNPKPAPDPVLKACEDMSVQPHEAVFVGDTETDVKAGRKAGCKVIGFGVNADYQISNLLEIKKILT